jgi:hypothetical protein
MKGSRMKFDAMKLNAVVAVALAALLLGVTQGALAANGSRFEVAMPDKLSGGSITGRLIVAVSTKEEPEPRQTIGLVGAAIFGVDVEQLKAGAVAVVDEKAESYPLQNLKDLAPGDYFVQAVMIRYDEVHRSDGRVLWVPTQHQRIPFHMLPGNPYSKVQKLHVDAGGGASAKLELTEVIPPTEPPKDTPWIRHVRIQSKLLTKFWGTPIYLSANVLVPKGFDEHPKAQYPAVYAMSHGPEPYSFDPDPTHDTEDGRKAAHATNVQTGYEFYQTWISDGYPRFVAIAMEQSSPYFLEAYSVDSVNNGPYGQAITQELIPYLEKKFRLIAQPYGRIVQGASTGGWEALAMQLHYPDYFGGAWVFNPDPIDFTHYQQMNIYKDDNAFAVQMSPFQSTERPFRRTVEGQVTHTFRQLAQLEAVMGSKGRSGYQLDGWQSVHGPVGPDGYSALLFDKHTGKIDRTVAEYMREHGYDLTEFTRRNWSTLGPKLMGKLNFFSGEMDNFYLNLAVYDYQAMLKETSNPHYEARFEFGRPKQGHSWHLTDFSQMIREMAEHVKKTAPADAETSQWSY